MTDYPAPSWEVFAECKRCGARLGMPCKDLRGQRSIGGSVRAMRNPHPGRKKIKK